MSFRSQRYQTYNINTPVISFIIGHLSRVIVANQLLSAGLEADDQLQDCISKHGILYKLISTTMSIRNLNLLFGLRFTRKKNDSEKSSLF